MALSRRTAPAAQRSRAYLAALKALHDAGGIYRRCSVEDAPAVILRALQEHILAIAMRDAAMFDRGYFDRCMGLWDDLAAETHAQAPRDRA